MKGNNIQTKMKANLTEEENKITLFVLAAGPQPQVVGRCPVLV
jgi:hypothetical protein